MKKPILFFLFTLCCFLYSGASSARTQTRDEILLDKLNKGNGAFIIKNMMYLPKGGTKPKDVYSYHSFDDFLQQGMKYKNFKQGNMFYLPPGSNKEKSITPNKYNHFLVIGPPGEYTITQVMYDQYLQICSIKVLKKINVEAGKLKYAGDLNVLMFHHVLFWDYRFKTTFKPDEAKSEIQQAYPESSKTFVAEPMLPMNSNN